MALRSKLFGFHASRSISPNRYSADPFALLRPSLSSPSMGGGGDLRELFFSADGRIARTPFWIAAAVVYIPTFLYASIGSPTLYWLTGWAVYPAAIYVGTCVLSKRLHDRGRSGWFAALVIIALIAVLSGPLSFFDFFWLGVLAWGLIEIGLMPGEQGANRFGINPLAA